MSSASSYSLYYGYQQGPVRIRVNDGIITATLHNNEIIKLNILNGVLKISNGGHPTMTTANAIKRFFELIECKRYKVNTSAKDGVKITDLKTKQTYLIDEDGKYVPIPVRCVMRVFANTSYTAQTIGQLFRNLDAELAAMQHQSQQQNPQQHPNIPF